MTAAGTERDDFGYEPFTRHDFYEMVNRALVDDVIGRLNMRPTGDGLTIVDLGCGTGAVTMLVVEALQKRGLAATIVGVEPSASALAQAERRLAGSGMDVRFVQGDAADLARLGTPVDALFFCNAIHLVPDKNQAMADVARVLVPGGVFAFNSSFFTGAYAPGTDNFYYLWTVHAIRWLRREHPQIRPSKGGEKTLARQWLSPAEYSGLLRDNGFEVQLCELEQVQMNLASFVDIGRYWLFIEGALPGVPLPAGADALEHGVRETFAEKGLSSVPRNWLQVIASLAPDAG